MTMKLKSITEAVFFLMVVTIVTSTTALATARTNSLEYAVIEEMGKLALEEALNDNEMAEMQSLICSNANPLAGKRAVVKGVTDNVNDFLKSKIDTKFPEDKDCALGITLKQILKLANSVVPKNKRPFNIDKHSTSSFAYLPAGVKNAQCPTPIATAGKFYESGTRTCEIPKVTNKRNHKDSEMCLVKDCPKVEEYWSGWTPCFFCETGLLEWKKTQNAPVTIYIGKRYQTLDKSKETSLFCLALMRKKGFNLKAWDWGKFKTEIVADEECERAINLIMMCKEFEDQVKEVKEMLSTVDHLYKIISEEELAKKCK